MTNSIVINDKNRTIEITKKFAAVAKHYNTTEYDALQAVRKDYPNYRVQIKTVTKKADHFKGLSFDFMEQYIKNHKEELLSDFFILSGKNEKGEEQEFAAAATYGEIKKWFLKQFPELNIKRKTIDEILGKTAA